MLTFFEVYTEPDNPSAFRTETSVGFLNCTHIEQNQAYLGLLESRGQSAGSAMIQHPWGSRAQQCQIGPSSFLFGITFTRSTGTASPNGFISLYEGSFSQFFQMVPKTLYKTLSKWENYMVACRTSWTADNKGLSHQSQFTSFILEKLTNHYEAFD